MKTNINFLNKILVGLMVLVIVSCADENLKPIITFDDAIHGAYPRLISETGEQLVNVLTQADFDNSSYGYSIRFIDEAKGGNVDVYRLNVEYVDVTGTNSGAAKELKSYNSSDFAADETGYMSLSGVGVTGPELAGAFGLAYADLNPGDVFKVTGEMVMKSGLVHTGSNSSATVKGAAFQGHFDFNMAVGCPSDLEQTLNFVTDLTPGGWFADGDVPASTTGTVDIEATGGGSYTFSDWSFGGYLEAYGCCGASGGMAFTDVCTEVSYVASTQDSYGDNWTIVMTVDPGDNTILIVEWRNDYAGGYEGGDTRITFPGGVPFTVVQ